MEGVISINSELNPVILKTKLESFLTPSDREVELVSYTKIRERFNIEREQHNKEEKEGSAEKT
jgi:chemotaxis protein MotA